MGKALEITFIPVYNILEFVVNWYNPLHIAIDDYPNALEEAVQPMKPRLRRTVCKGLSLSTADEKEGTLGESPT